MTEAMIESTTPPSIQYGEWTRAIGAHFFRSGLGAKPTYLVFDEAIATQIGRSFGLKANDFITSVAAVIDVSADNPFFDAALHECGEEFPYLGILAAQVYVATRMGSFGNLDPSAYWRPFQDFFTAGRPLRQQALDRLDGFWSEARMFYETRERGRLAIQNDPQNVPHVGWRHINLPLWQALLRESDRTQICQWLSERPGQKPDSSRILRDLVANADDFNRKLAQTLHDTTRNAALSAALEVLVRDLVVSPVDEPKTRTRRTPGRLRLVGRRELSCILQRRNNGDEWVDATASLETEDIRHGITDDSTGVTWRGDDRILFIDGGPFVGFVSHRGPLPAGSTVILVFLQLDDVSEQFDTVRGKPIPLDPNLSGFTATKLNVTDEDDPLLLSFGCRLATDRPIRLEGGLRHHSRYLGTHPPRIVAASSSTPVRVNGTARSVRPDGSVDLPNPLLPGPYEVTALGDILRFDVDDGALLDDSNDCEEICFALSRSGVMHTSTVDGVPTAHYLVGAYLGTVPQ